MVDPFNDMPLLGPAAVVALAVAVGLAVPVGRWLRAPAPLAFLLLASAGAVVAATLTPTVAQPWSTGCQTGALALPRLAQLRYLNETSLNVALFVPLGLACGLLPGRWRAATACLVATAVPAGIELAQAELTWLNRVCATADIVANLTGLTVGVTVAVVLIRPWLTRLWLDRP